MKIENVETKFLKEKNTKFDLYLELFGKDFLPTHYNKESRAKGRSRLFKLLVKKYLADWKIDNNFSTEMDFNLMRKK